MDYRCFRCWAPSSPADEAAPYAAALGRAFQLTNFLRDVAEDLTRNRIYLPADELAAFGVDRELMMWCHLHRRTDARVRDALAAQHHITREIYDSPPTGSPAGTAFPALRGHRPDAVLGDSGSH